MILRTDERKEEKGGKDREKENFTVSISRHQKDNKKKYKKEEEENPPDEKKTVGGKGRRRKGGKCLLVFMSRRTWVSREKDVCGRFVRARELFVLVIDNN